MSSSGLKLRDPRELLANPDRRTTVVESTISSPTSSLEDPDIGISAEHLSSTKVITSMSPSLAVAMANANTSPSNQKDNLNSDSAAVQSSTHESEPIPKKRRILDATETSQDEKEPKKQQDSSEDILARACSAVGIGGDLAESVLEEPLPIHQDYNGEITRGPTNYPYVRGVRPPPPSIPIPPRPRHLDDIRVHHPFHPAFRHPSDSPYGMEVRPLYGHAYAVPRRVPVHPGEPHRYYAMQRYSCRYPYVGPPGSIPPPMTRPPIMRAAAPRHSPHEGHPSTPNAAQGYPYDPRHLPRPALLHGSPSPTSPLHHDPRVSPSELHNSRSTAASEIHPLQTRLREVQYRLPSPHGLNTLPAVSPEQLSPTAAPSHPYPRDSPIPIRPKLHITPNAHLDGPRSPHESYVTGLPPRVRPPTRSPHPRSPTELTCQNPFQLPEPPGNTNVVFSSNSSPVGPQHDASLKSNSFSLDRNELEVSILPPRIVEEHSEGKNMSNSQSYLPSRRLREPPEPCVELIPISVPIQKENRNKSDKLRQIPMESAVVPNSHGINSNLRETIKSPMNNVALGKEGPPPWTRQLSSDNKRISEVIHQESEQKCEVSSVPSPKLDSVLASTTSHMEKVLEKPDVANKDPKRAFRKRWLDKQDTDTSKKSAKFVSTNFSGETKKFPEKEVSPVDVSKKEETTIIILDDDECETKDTEHRKSSSLRNQSGPDMRMLGPGQLHCLHSSMYINQNRSASEPPIGTPLPPHNIIQASKRPASVPGANQLSQSTRVPNESQSETSSASAPTKPVKTTEADRENDDAFISRLKLVLNDLISVPEATKLKHLSCSVDELLASIVKLRGATPSNDPDPRQRLRQDFVILVKLCMPPHLLEAWGWNNSSPEEILDELIKVTNSGIDGSKGNPNLTSAKDCHPTPHASPHPPAHHPEISISVNIIPPPHPLVSLSPEHSHSSTSPQEQASLAQPAIPLIHQSQLPTAQPVLSPLHQVPVSTNHPYMYPRHSIPVSSIHSPLSISHRASVPSSYPTTSHHLTSHVSTHPSISSRHPIPHLTPHPSLSPQHSLPHTAKHSPVSLHPIPAPRHPSNYSPSSFNPTTSIPSHHPPPSTHHAGMPPTTRHPVPPLVHKTSIPSAHSESSVPQEDHLEDDVFSPTSREPSYSPASQSSMTASHMKLPVQMHPYEQRQKNGSPVAQVTQPHVAYSHSTTTYVQSQSSANTHNPPVTVVHYSQLPQQSHNASPYHSQHSAVHYATPRSAHPSHSPSHYPRGPYRHPYPYSYYHPTGPHPPPPPPYHRLPYHQPNMAHAPRHPYRPHGIPKSANTHGAVRLVAQPPTPLSTGQWNGTEGERIEKANTVKHPA